VSCAQSAQAPAWSSTSHESSDVAKRTSPVRTVLIGLGLLYAFTAIYTAAYHEPQPHGVPVGIVGSEPPAALVGLAFGGFALHRYANEPAARQALLHTATCMACS
jgi:hypothetical protein